MIAARLETYRHDYNQHTGEQMPNGISRSFTRGAREFQKTIAFQISLKDYASGSLRRACRTSLHSSGTTLLRSLQSRWKGNRRTTSSSSPLRHPADKPDFHDAD